MTFAECEWSASRRWWGWLLLLLRSPTSFSTTGVAWGHGRFTPAGSRVRVAWLVV